MAKPVQNNNQKIDVFGIKHIFMKNENNDDVIISSCVRGFVPYEKNRTLLDVGNLVPWQLLIIAYNNYYERL